MVEEEEEEEKKKVHAFEGKSLLVSGRHTSL